MEMCPLQKVGPAKGPSAQPQCVRCSIYCLYISEVRVQVQEQIINSAGDNVRNPERQTCAAMNFGLMKELPVTIPLLAFRRILRQHQGALAAQVIVCTLLLYLASRAYPSKLDALCCALERPSISCESILQALWAAG